ncbi:MAG: D-tyrosyl-tRNA(Tyr) deacylase [Opitutae bacterium]|nr:D-tyrosyl-tRNA(Tyr) deacylase [Opitutae bacterium]
MRVVVQRVSSASVTIAGRVVGRIGRGLLVFVGIEAADTPTDGEWLAQKLVKLRLFADETGQMNKSVADIGGGILLISQFTLHASTQKGTRPSFHAAARPEHARPLYEQFIAQVCAALARPPDLNEVERPAVSGVERVQTGEFGAHMDIALVNDGPVTLILDSKARE